jgi:aspartokinase
LIRLFRAKEIKFRVVIKNSRNKHLNTIKGLRRILLIIEEIKPGTLIKRRDRKIGMEANIKVRVVNIITLERNIGKINIREISSLEEIGDIEHVLFANNLIKRMYF